MSNPTYTQLTRFFGKQPSNYVREQKKVHMQFCMIETLKESGINPKSASFEWSLDRTSEGETWTYTAHWGEKRAEPSRVLTPLTDTNLIICARANANRGIEVASSLCGYGQDLHGFQQALQQAGEHLGIKINGFDDLQQGFNSPRRTELAVAS